MNREYLQDWLNEHFYYEIRMYFEKAKIDISIETQYLKNVYLEQFWLHGRNLYQFFFPGQNPRSDDITVYQFIKKEQWDNDSRIQSLKKEIKENFWPGWRISKECMHLTQKRITWKPPTKGFDVVKHDKVIKHLIETFISKLEQDKTFKTSEIKKLCSNITTIYTHQRTSHKSRLIRK